MLAMRIEVLSGIGHKGVPALRRAEVICFSLEIRICYCSQTTDKHSADRVLEGSFVGFVFHRCVLYMNVLSALRISEFRKADKVSADSDHHGDLRLDRTVEAHELLWVGYL